MNKLQTLIIIFLFFIGFISSSAQPPKKVVSAFSAKFGNVTNLEWTHEKNGFEASFLKSDKRYYATFNVSGQWLDTETEIPITDLPEIVQNTFFAKFGKTQRIIAASKIEKNDGVLFFVIEYKSGLSTTEIIYDQDGKTRKLASSDRVRSW